MNSQIFDKFSFISLFLLVVLLPFFFLPFTSIPVEISKGLLLVVGLAACVTFWVIARFIDGKVIFPKSTLILAGFGVALSFLLSVIFSGNSPVSWFGTMFDLGSFWFIFSAFMLMFMSSIIFKTPKKAKMVLLGIILSSIFVLIFQSAHLFMPTFLSLGVLVGKTGNVFGSWNALGIFTGFATLMFLLVIEFFPISKIEKSILLVFILLAILLGAIVNFPLVWILLGISSLVIFVYKVSINFQINQEGEQNDKRNFPLVSFIVVIMSLLFFMSGNFISDITPGRIKVANTEVFPSFSATMSTTKAVLSKNPVFGIGPNRFEEAWAMNKPVSVNTDTIRGVQFWDTSFNSGFGLLLTLVSTTGYLSIFALLVFLILFLITGTKSIFLSVKNGENWEMIAFFVLSLYLFISSFFYSTGTVIFLLSLSFTGVFVGLNTSNSNKEISMSFLNDHRKSFFSILALVCIVIFSVTISFKYVEKFASVPHFSKAFKATTIPIAEESINKVLRLHVNDLYLRTYAQIYLLKFNSLAQKGESLSDAEKTDLQTSLDESIEGAQFAIDYNPKNYLNFVALGSVFQTAGSIGVKDAYGRALESYKIASTLNPNNPALKIAMSNISRSLGQNKEAKDYANLALTLKPDYIDAFVTLSQIAKSEGNNAEALSYAQKALSVFPTNPDLIKYVDSLKTPTPTSTQNTNTKKP